MQRIFRDDQRWGVIGGLIPGLFIEPIGAEKIRSSPSSGSPSQRPCCRSTPAIVQKGIPRLYPRTRIEFSRSFCVRSAINWNQCTKQKLCHQKLRSRAIVLTKVLDRPTQLLTKVWWMFNDVSWRPDLGPRPRTFARRSLPCQTAKVVWRDRDRQIAVLAGTVCTHFSAYIQGITMQNYRSFLQFSGENERREHP